MPRIVVTITDQMEKDLKAVSKAQGASMSELVRRYIANGLIEAGMKGERDYVVTVGGPRQQDDQND